MSDEPRSPQLEHIGSLLVDLALSKARTMLPGQVVSYDDAAQSVVVQILINDAHLDETEDDVSTTHPLIADVPVAQLGGGVNRITVPVKVGDYGRVVFASREIARWKLTGGIVDPASPRMHDINDCVFEPGLHVLGKAPTPAPDDAIVTHGPTKIGGPTDTQKTAMMVTYRAAEDTLIDGLVAALGAVAGVFTAIGALGGVFAPVVPLATAFDTYLSSTLAPIITAFKGADSTYKTTEAEVK